METRRRRPSEANERRGIEGEGGVVRIVLRGRQPRDISPSRTENDGIYASSSTLIHRSTNEYVIRIGRRIEQCLFWD
ncbi:hypothetical protein ACHAW5_006703 [Stephanodiscus triporus]|uniref:Uncharacterized protein n=1 Tax=Stephanodiscus triporus TaxID=2934178 RepID=A0ABD3NC81_9STRA